MIANLVGLVLVYFAYIYLRNLSNCSCVNQIYVERLKGIEIIMMSLSIIGIITSLVINLFMKDFTTKLIQNYTKYILYGFTIFALIMMVIYSYFVYDTYMFSSTMSIPCKCADGWQKYYIYFQAISMIFIIIGSAILGISLASGSRNVKRNKNKRSKR